MADDYHTNNVCQGCFNAAGVMWHRASTWTTGLGHSHLLRSRNDWRLDDRLRAGGEGMVQWT